MAVPLRVLFVGEQPQNIELALAALRQAGFDPDWRSVATETDDLANTQARKYLEVAGVIFVVIGPDQTVRLINRKGCEVLGYDEDEIIGKNWFDAFIPEPVRETTRTVFNKLMAGEIETVEDFENPVLTRSGEVKIIAWHNTVLTNEDGAIIGTLSSGEDITARRQAEEKLDRLNRAYQALSECNQILVRSTEETDLLHRVCQVLVEIGGYVFAWVGYVSSDESRTVQPVAWAGFQNGYLDGLILTSRDMEKGRGPTGTAIRTGQPQVARSIRMHPGYGPYREKALQRGYESSVALPLADNERVFGALTIYAGRPDAFDDEELRLLTELADDLAYGIVALRTREQHRRAAEALRREHDMLERLTETSPVGISVVDRDGRITFVNARADSGPDEGRNHTAHLQCSGLAYHRLEGESFS